MSLNYSWRRGAVLLALIGLAVRPAAAQSGSTGFDQPSYLTTPKFASLVDGSKSVVVITKDGRDYEGHFTISGNALVLVREFSTTTVPFDQVARVQKSTYRIRLHSLIGVGVGSLIGGVVGASLCDYGDCGGVAFSFMVIGGGIGAGVGAGVGASLNSSHYWRDMIYDAGTRPRTVAVAPIISSTRKGVNVVMTWR